MHHARSSLVALLLIASCGKSSDDRASAGVQLQAERDVYAKANAKQAADLSTAVNALIAMQQDLDRQLATAEAELAASTSQDARDAATAKLAALREKQGKVQKRMAELKAGVPPRCPPDNPLC